MSECIHDLAEMETACADGLCPICMQAENERLRKRYKDYERLWDIAEKYEDCDGDCDSEPPHEACPGCSASRLINELGEIRYSGLKNIEQVLKEKE